MDAASGSENLSRYYTFPLVTIISSMWRPNLLAGHGAFVIIMKYRFPENERVSFRESNKKRPRRSFVRVKFEESQPPYDIFSISLDTREKYDEKKTFDSVRESSSARVLGRRFESRNREPKRCRVPCERRLAPSWAMMRRTRGGRRTCALPRYMGFWYHPYGTGSRGRFFFVAPFCSSKKNNSTIQSQSVLVFKTTRECKSPWFYASSSLWIIMEETCMYRGFVYVPRNTFLQELPDDPSTWGLGVTWKFWNNWRESHRKKKHFFTDLIIVYGIERSSLLFTSIIEWSRSRIDNKNQMNWELIHFFAAGRESWRKKLKILNIFNVFFSSWNAVGFSVCCGHEKKEEELSRRLSRARKFALTRFFGRFPFSR